MKLETILLALILIPSASYAQSLNVPWTGYAHDPQHTATSATAAQTLHAIHWQTPIDLSGAAGGSGSLFVHYGSPVVTAANTIIVPVTNASGDYQLEAFNGATGSPIYTLSSCILSGCYTAPATPWTPPYGPALSLGTRLYYPGPGGTIFYRTSPDSASGTTAQTAFYGSALYNANQAAFNDTVRISTPLTADRSGNIFFGYIVTGANPAGLPVGGGIARVPLAGAGKWVSATSLTGDTSSNYIAFNCAPALSNTQTTVYVATSTGAEFGTGYLASFNATLLTPIAHVPLYDPRGGVYGLATVSSDSSAAPMVGPDGDVYYGVLENSCCSSHNDRGWMLHFDSTLTQSKIPGSFGWDNTPSVVPSSAVPSYAGTSSYLILTKYNNYAGIGTGNGENKIAILDPNVAMQDEYSASPVNVMQEVITVTGVTPAGSPPAVREWCINTAVIDPYTKAAIINSEDGTVYRWDFTTNTLLQSVILTPGRGEAYTPTVIGPDGTVYAINDAILFAVGQ